MNSIKVQADGMDCGRDFNVECSITTLYSTERETEE